MTAQSSQGVVVVAGASAPASSLTSSSVGALSQGAGTVGEASAAGQTSEKRLRPIINWIKNNASAAWNWFVQQAKRSYNALRNAVVSWWNDLNSAVRWLLQTLASFSIEELVRAIWDAIF
ncbi:hypothetical protein GC089_11420 [Cellulomonas sp. JZ18]|uniref:hypothetical protein n=1 Tax=Cellulomonas sp. JZ18 TaxID=2654191 RepID=UPI0012D4048C|nr:hypothetical protein [Cellulomonas sp. JZ18]QGQ19725.1 hypothetical protein GC089_11420 [Cellulomonas sp. JZ18]